MITNITESNFDDYVNIKIHPSNVEELNVVTGIEPGLCLAMLWEVSKNKTSVFVKGKLICLFGIVPPHNFWLLFSDGITKLPLSFFKESRKVVKTLHQQYGFIDGYIYIKNEFALKWAKFIGWNIDDPAPQGKYNKLCYHFYCGKES